MRSLRPYMACLILFLTSPHGQVAADDETAQLKLRVQLLEAEVKALREEVRGLKNELTKVPGGKSEEARLATDVRLLSHLLKALEKLPENLDPRSDAADLRSDTAALAKRVARDCPCRVVWKALLKTGALRDGVSVQEAEKILGPPTDKSDKHVGWYFNPHNSHVAPCLHAKVTKEGLAEWKIDNR